MISNEILNAFWTKIAPLKYLVMRNYVDMVSDLNAGGDIDLLVDSKEYFIKLTGAIPLHDGKDCYNYNLLVEGQKIPVDVRVIGDGYYDARWEEDMLRHREARDQFYVMDCTDYKYSILYHCLLHKKRITEKYIQILFGEFQTNSVSAMKKQLVEYMKKYGYNFCRPMDHGVCFNRKQYVELRLRVLL